MEEAVTVIVTFEFAIVLGLRVCVYDRFGAIDG